MAVTRARSLPSPAHVLVTISLALLAAAPAIGAPVSQNDAGSGRDATDSAPVPIVAGIRYEGLLLPPLDPRDHYTFPVRAGDNVFFETAGVAHVAEIIDETGRQRAVVVYSGLVLAPTSATAMHNATWSLRFRSVADVAEPYAFSLGINGSAPPVTPQLAQDDAGTGRDAPNSPIGAIPLAPGVTYQGDFVGEARQGSYDYYAIDLRAGETLTLVTNAVFAYPLVYRPDGQRIEHTAVDIPGYAELRYLVVQDGLHHVEWSRISQSYDMTYGLGGREP